MSKPWAKNFCGLHCNDFELLKIPHPRTELTVHVTIKNVTSGVVLGSLVGAVQSLVQQGTYDEKDMKVRVTNAGMKGALVGLVTGPLLTAFIMRNKQTHEVYDRCYRLRFNTTSLFYDRMSVAGGLIGAAVAGPTGFVLGVDLGVFGGILTRSLFSRNRKDVVDFQRLKDGMQ